MFLYFDGSLKAVAPCTLIVCIIFAIRCLSMMYPAHLIDCSFATLAGCEFCNKFNNKFFFYLFTGNTRVRHCGGVCAFWDAMLTSDIDANYLMAEAEEAFEHACYKRPRDDDEFPNLSRSHSEPDLNTGLFPYPMWDPDERNPVRRMVIDLRPDTTYYKLACLVPRGALTYFLKHGIDGIPAVKRLRFADGAFDRASMEHLRSSASRSPMSFEGPLREYSPPATKRGRKGAY